MQSEVVGTLDIEEAEVLAEAYKYRSCERGKLSGHLERAIAEVKRLRARVTELESGLVNVIAADEHGTEMSEIADAAMWPRSAPAQRLRAELDEMHVGLSHFYRLGYSLQRPSSMRAAGMPESVIAACTVIRDHVLAQEAALEDAVDSRAVAQGAADLQTQTIRINKRRDCVCSYDSFGMLGAIAPACPHHGVQADCNCPFCREHRNGSDAGPSAPKGQDE